MLLADFRSFVDAQQQVGMSWCDTEHWARMSILNTARSGKFSSDRSIRDYCRDIWNVAPVKIALHGRKAFQGGLGQ
jgi:starch phosphorylase